MSADKLLDTYNSLTESLSLPADEVNKSAKLLAEAPESGFITKKMRLEAIVAHPNYSRETYEMLLRFFEPETLTALDTNIIHMLISYENVKLEDVKTLHTYAETSGNAEWFSRVVMKTIELNEYQLGLTYNGASVFHDRDLRERLIYTIALLKEFQQGA